ncbi:MAG: HEAT repeat domain-containing protein [Planctomycetota bacterium]|nr:HEAT repeat domain-containing protein [Planctomycetota bacterium]
MSGNRFCVLGCALAMLSLSLLPGAGLFGQDDADIDKLIAGLKDEDPLALVRGTPKLENLEKLVAMGERAVPALIKQFEKRPGILAELQSAGQALSPDSRQALNVIEALVRIGRPSVGSLVVVVAGGDADLRELASMMLIVIGPDAAPEIEPLLKLKDPEVRWCAAKTLGKLCQAAGFPVIAENIKAGDVRSRLEALEILTDRLHDYRSFPLLASLLDDSTLLDPDSAGGSGPASGGTDKPDLRFCDKAMESLAKLRDEFGKTESIPTGSFIMPMMTGLHMVKPSLPMTGATRAEKVAQWKAWWEKNGKDFETKAAGSELGELMRVTLMGAILDEINKVESTAEAREKVLTEFHEALTDWWRANATRMVPAAEAPDLLGKCQKNDPKDRTARLVSIKKMVAQLAELQVALPKFVQVLLMKSQGEGENLPFVELLVIERSAALVLEDALKKAEEPPKKGD